MEALPIHILRDILILCEPEDYNALTRTCKTINNLSTGNINIDHGTLTEDIYRWRAYYDFSAKVFACRLSTSTYLSFYKQVRTLRKSLNKPDYKPDMLDLITENKIQEFKILTTLELPTMEQKETLDSLIEIHYPFLSHYRSPIPHIDFPDKKKSYLFLDKKNMILYVENLLLPKRCINYLRYESIFKIEYDHGLAALNLNKFDLFMYIFESLNYAYKYKCFIHAVDFCQIEMITWLSKQKMPLSPEVINFLNIFKIIGNHYEKKFNKFISKLQKCAKAYNNIEIISLLQSW